jgi:hypothetical protein
VAGKGVTFVNQAAVAGLVEYRAFEFPVGSDRTWRVDPLPYLTGQQITALELDLMEVSERVAVEQKRGDLSARTLREVQDKYNAVIRRGVTVAGPLMIPTGPRKWRRRLARRFGHNPLSKATDRDVAAVIGFLARCLMLSQSRVRQAVAARN